MIVGCLNARPRYRIIFRGGEAVYEPVNVPAAIMHGLFITQRISHKDFAAAVNIITQKENE